MVSPAAKTAQQRAIDRASQKNLDYIMSEARKSLEIQVLLVSTLEEFNAQKAGTQVSRKKTRASASDPAGEREEIRDESAPAFVIAPSVGLGRAGTRYAGWKKGLLLEVFSYCDGVRWSNARKLLDSLVQCQQVFEYAAPRPLV